MENKPAPILHLSHKPFEVLKHICDKKPTTINVQNTVPHTVNSIKKVDK